MAEKSKEFLSSGAKIGHVGIHEGAGDHHFKTAFAAWEKWLKK